MSDYEMRILGAYTIGTIIGVVAAIAIIKLVFLPLFG